LTETTLPTIVKVGISSGNLDSQDLEIMKNINSPENHLIFLAKDIIQNRYATSYGKELGIHIFLMQDSVKAFFREKIFLNLVIQISKINSFH
jgi:hypothetical protein